MGAEGEEAVAEAVASLLVASLEKQHADKVKN